MSDVHETGKQRFIPQSLKIVFHCSKCGQPIRTWFDEDGDIDGWFVGVESVFSEMLNKWVTVKAKCWVCI